MKQVPRNVALTLAASLVVGCLVGQVSAADRRPVGSEPVVVAPAPSQPTPAERLMATRREFRAIVVDTGLASVDVTELVERADWLSQEVSVAMVYNPEQFHGLTTEEIVAGKMQPVFAEKGLDDATITHLTALVLALTNQQIEVEVQAPVGSVMAPPMEGSPR